MLIVWSSTCVEPANIGLAVGVSIEANRDFDLRAEPRNILVIRVAAGETSFAGAT